MKQYLAISPNIHFEDCIIFNAGNIQHAKEILKSRIRKDTLLQEIQLIELQTGNEKQFFIENKK